jgi:hypothetical protein
MASFWELTPNQSISLECDRRSPKDVVRDCVSILEGKKASPDFLRVLAGPAADTVLDGREGGVNGYWPHVWAARGLLHVWNDTATDAIIVATTYGQWRVQEMATKVIARHHVSPAIDAVVALLDDDNARVRTAAARALRVIAEESRE